MGDGRQSALEQLRRRAETALERNGRGAEAETLLERIVELADQESEHALFAHRHLAELRLERHPWRAALHLRRVLAVRPNDDVPHALMGLCQALMGNYRVAVGSYRRALAIAPSTPWYHHNLGHLLDVALDQPRAAEPHLSEAIRIEPDHDEILASYAHCLARLGKKDEAAQVARRARSIAPKNEEHARLLEWIEKGAPGVYESGHYEAPKLTTDDRTNAVRESFEKRMREAGYAPSQIDQARSLWTDFHGRRENLRMRKPEVYAAAVEYAIAQIHARRGATQAQIARRYGVAPGSLSSRYGEIRQVLALTPFDPRYS